MTVTVNDTQIDKGIITAAQKLAAKEGMNVVIFEAEVDDKKKHFIAIVPDFDGSPHRNTLKSIAIIDKDGNYVD